MNQSLIEQADEYSFYAKLSDEEKLIKYIQFENLQNVSKLLNKDIDINYRNKLGFTPLMYAAINDNVELMELLIRNGAKIDIKTNTGLSVLEISKFNGSRNAYKYLITKVNDTTKNFYMGNAMIDLNKKYSPFEIIKNVIYCENLVTGKKLLNNIEQDILLYGDYRTQMIMAFIAIYILDNQGKEDFEIVIADSCNIIPITGNILFNGLCGGLNLKNNIVQISSKGEFAHTSRTLMHELTHKVHTILEYTDSGMLTACLKKFKAIVYLMKHKAAKDWLKKNMVERIDGEIYQDETLKLEEIIADMANATIYANGLEDFLLQKLENDLKNNISCNTNNLIQREILKNIDNVRNDIVCDIKDTRKNILLAIKPMQEYFDVVMMPQMAEYILKSPYFKNLNLQDELKIKLRQIKCKNRTVGQCFIKNTPEKSISKFNLNNNDRGEMYFL